MCVSRGRFVTGCVGPWKCLGWWMSLYLSWCVEDVWLLGNGVVCGWLGVRGVSVFFVLSGQGFVGRLVGGVGGLVVWWVFGSDSLVVVLLRGGVVVASFWLICIAFVEMLIVGAGRRKLVVRWSGVSAGVVFGVGRVAFSRLRCGLVRWVVLDKLLRVLKDGWRWAAPGPCLVGLLVIVVLGSCGWWVIDERGWLRWEMKCRCTGSWEYMCWVMCECVLGGGGAVGGVLSTAGGLFSPVVDLGVVELGFGFVGHSGASVEWSGRSNGVYGVLVFWMWGYVLCGLGELICGFLVRLEDGCVVGCDPGLVLVGWGGVLSEVGVRRVVGWGFVFRCGVGFRELVICAVGAGLLVAGRGWPAGQSVCAGPLWVGAVSVYVRGAAVVCGMIAACHHVAVEGGVVFGVVAGLLELCDWARVCWSVKGDWFVEGREWGGQYGEGDGVKVGVWAVGVNLVDCYAPGGLGGVGGGSRSGLCSGVVWLWLGLGQACFGLVMGAFDVGVAVWIFEFVLEGDFGGRCAGDWIYGGFLAVLRGVVLLLGEVVLVDRWLEGRVVVYAGVRLVCWCMLWGGGVWLESVVCLGLGLAVRLAMRCCIIRGALSSLVWSWRFVIVSVVELLSFGVLPGRSDVGVSGLVGGGAVSWVVCCVSRGVGVEFW
ncbi:hypothetical protein Tco_1047062 [Tanacetum coccineum]